MCSTTTMTSNVQRTREALASSVASRELSTCGCYHQQGYLRFASDSKVGQALKSFSKGSMASQLHDNKNKVSSSSSYKYYITCCFFLWCYCYCTTVLVYSMETQCNKYLSHCTMHLQLYIEKSESANNNDIKNQNKSWFYSRIAIREVGNSNTVIK